ncbi:MAG: rRNA maturation RNase YbeY [Bacteroidetes bacterium]|nr:rRNA maturation RNase YbeY [Bacteroidota bacterium]
MISFDAQNEFTLDHQEDWTAWLVQVIKIEGFNLGSLAYIFCDDDFLLKLNQDFLNHDTLTDIITFDNNVGRTIHGEIYISTDRVIENSQEYGVSVMNELARVVVHGVLHLCGYKDKSEEDVLKMRGREDYWIEKLNLLNNN